MHRPFAILMIFTLFITGCDNRDSTTTSTPSTTPPTTPPTTPSACQFSVPQAPDPLPAGFDWQPLAQDWCNQLAACGYDTTDCISTYLQFANNPASAVSSAADTSPGEESEIVDLVCEDSEEFYAGTISCGGEDYQQQQLPPEELN